MLPVHPLLLSLRLVPAVGILGTPNLPGLADYVAKTTSPPQLALKGGSTSLRIGQRLVGGIAGLWQAHTSWLDYAG